MSAELIEEWRKIVYRDDGPMDARLKVSRSELRRLFEAMDVERVPGYYWCVAHRELSDALGLTECDVRPLYALGLPECDVRPLYIKAKP